MLLTRLGSLRPARSRRHMWLAQLTFQVHFSHGNQDQSAARRPGGMPRVITTSGPPESGRLHEILPVGAASPTTQLPGAQGLLCRS